MSVKVVEKVWPLDLAALDLQAGCKVVLVRMADFADHDGGSVRPSVARVSAECGLSERTTQRAIKELVDAGILVLVAPGHPGLHRPAEYRIDMALIKTLPAFDWKEAGRQPDTPRGVTVTPRPTERGVSVSPLGCQADTPRGVTVTPNPSEIPVNIPVKEDRRLPAPEAEADLFGDHVEPETVDICAVAIGLWNDLAAKSGLRSVSWKGLNDARRKSLRARLKECDGIEGWKHALEVIADSPFLLGAGDRGWKISFDFLIKPDKFQRVMEGGYAEDTRADQPAASNANRPRTVLDAVQSFAGDTPEAVARRRALEIS